MLVPVANDIWLAEGPMVSFYGFPYPTRAVLVRLGSGGLWVWSPVRLDEGLQQAVDGLGPVEHLVSPNKLHHLYLAEWQEAYPQARLWAPRSTIRKRGDLRFEAPLEDRPPVAWQPDIDQAWFRGSPFLDEIVFCHLPSRTAIVGDLIEAFSDAFLERHWSWWQRPLARLDGITIHRPRAPLELRLSFRDKAPARAALQKVLSWEPERVVMAHGEWARAHGRDFLVRSFDWLGG